VNSTATLGDVLRSVELPFIVRELQGVLDSEQERRERFYDWLNPSRKAEFINGSIFVHSPARAKHLEATKRLLVLLEAYVAKHRLGLVTVEKALVCLTRNDYEPDLCFFRAERAAEITPDTLKFPPPDLAVEVLSDSTAENDRIIKFRDYALHGVSEYWIIDPDRQEVEQYALEGSEYRPVEPVGAGTLASRIVAGFEIPVKAIFNAEENFKVLRTIVS
jgi:Uma2 family endonuclease